MSLLRRIPPPPVSEESFTSPLHETRSTAWVGTALGVAVTVCFLTGLISHFAQQPVSWLPVLASPSWGYRVTQGMHVAFGIAAIPLTLVKLWTVYPKLFTWPPARSVLHGLERLFVGLLVVATLFELTTGLLNIAHWYPWKFAFVPTHYAVAWLLAGSILLHLAVKAPDIRRAYTRSRDPDLASPAQESPGLEESPPEPVGARGLTRRGLLLTTTAAVCAVTLTTVGQSVPWLERFAVLAPRHPTDGPQGLAVNRTPQAAGVTRIDPLTYRLSIGGPRPVELDMAAFAALPQTEVDLPIACVEGWSALATWRGVRLAELLDLAGVPADATVRVVSMEAKGAYRMVSVPPEFARNPLTLLATELNGQTLSLEHGYPVRMIAPNRPGVLQTKWIQRVEVE